MPCRSSAGPLHPRWVFVVSRWTPAVEAIGVALLVCVRCGWAVPWLWNGALPWGGVVLLHRFWFSIVAAVVGQAPQ